MHGSGNTYYDDVAASHEATSGKRPTAGLTEAILTRFWGKVNRIDGGCWLWTGSADHSGRGMFKVGRNAQGKADNRYAHRMAYELTYGQLDKGRYLKQICGNLMCCNPEHLRLLPRRPGMLEVLAQRYGWTVEELTEVRRKAREREKSLR
jgi:hypothetical protein